MHLILGPCNTIEEIPVELSIKKKSSQTLISKNSSESNEKLNKSLNATVFTSDSREEKFEQLLKEPQMEIQELPPQRNKSLSLENIKEILDNSHFAPGCDFLIQNELQAVSYFC